MSFYTTENIEESVILLQDMPVNIGPDDEDDEEDDNFDSEDDNDLNDDINGEDLLTTNNGIDFDEIDRPGFDEDEEDDLYDDDL